jgi:2-polyprenyl-3-methyl-5-hydroxy-6-metoxy-1,4-benzoquinol methylase
MPLDRIHYQQCPVCANSRLSLQLTASDYTVSNEKFEVWECADCSLRFTQDVPVESAIGRYYQAESYISHTDSREGFIHRLYHAVRTYTLNQKRRLVQQESGLQSGMLLDMGAGTGAFVAAMQQAGWQAMGIEPDADTRARAASLHGLTLLDKLQFGDLPTQHFDVITLWHVLEHVEDLHGYMDRLHQLLKPGGVLIIAVPNYTSRDAALYGPHWAAYDVPRHLYHFSPRSMRVLLGRHQFNLSRILPMWFDSFYISMLSEQYKNGKAANLTAFLNGFRSNLNAWKHPEEASSLMYIIRPQ